MIRLALLIALVFSSVSAYAAEEKIKYYEDPVFQELNNQDVHPMHDLQVLAQEGDVRAQYILGDLYAKGKGGLAKNAKKGAAWFEKAGAQGYAAAFIRLAALSKHKKDYVSAWQWYGLAVQTGAGKERSYAQKARDEMVKDTAMSDADIDKAKTQLRSWKQKAAQDARDKAEAEKLEKRRAEVAEKAKKEAAPDTKVTEAKETNEKETEHVEN